MKTNSGLIIVLVAFMSCIESKTHYDYSFKETTETSGAKSWIFEGSNKPPLYLDNDSLFVKDVNLVLKSIGLPEIHTSVPEKSLKTGFRVDRGIFEWDNYPLGILKVTRSTCFNLKNESYDCIWKVTLKEINQRPQ